MYIPTCTKNLKKIREEGTYLIITIYFYILSQLDSTKGLDYTNYKFNT